MQGGMAPLLALLLATPPALKGEARTRVATQNNHVLVSPTLQGQLRQRAPTP
jgi:hypothetical protein